jgi:hypothetical protein
MRTLLTTLTTIAILLHVPPARAGTDDEEDEVDRDRRDPVLPQMPRFLIELGFVSSDMMVDRFETDIDAFVIAAGRLRGRTYYYGELISGWQHGKLDGERTSGFAGTASLRARRAVGRMHLDDKRESIWATADTWVDVGIGYQLLRWGDGQVGRPEVSLGIGGGYLLGKRSRCGGMGLELRLIVAPGARVESTAGRCIGACEPASVSLHRYDVGAQATFRFPFSW